MNAYHRLNKSPDQIEFEAECIGLFTQQWILNTVDRHAGQMPLGEDIVAEFIEDTWVCAQFRNVAGSNDPLYPSKKKMAEHFWISYNALRPFSILWAVHIDDSDEESGATSSCTDGDEYMITQEDLTSDEEGLDYPEEPTPQSPAKRPWCDDGTFHSALEVYNQRKAAGFPMDETSLYDDEY